MNGSRLLTRAAGLLCGLILGFMPWMGADAQFTLQATSLDTTFLYQGFLLEGAYPANGLYDFEFGLYDAAVDGDMVGTTTLTQDNLAVVDGLFQAALTFPAASFTGQALWLAIGVRPGVSDGPYTQLSPRQPLYSAPSALTLRPGAVIQGSMEEDVLRVNNYGEGMAIFAHTRNNDAIMGLCDAEEGAAVMGYHRGDGYGVYGLSDTLTGAAVYGYNRDGGPALEGRSYRTGGTGIALKASGKIVCTEQSIFFIPGVMGVLHGATSGAFLEYWGQGNVTINAETAGTKEIVFPINVPAVLYGQHVFPFRFHYGVLAASGTPNISRIRIYRTQYDGDARVVYDDNTDVPITSGSWLTTYFNLSEDNEMDFFDCQMALRFAFAMDAGERVEITGIRVQVRHYELAPTTAIPNGDH